ncbi:hypothetical protein CDL15_Pgr022130 [Punica granatum]|uniref:Uncharacterized protein n=1 Tax=Punica granatum TaxID=22663 RepID=A0A218VSA3_PUNGR|nr:hypothetical protein CDL15_Pgr022130 [Punica granatum]
MYAVLSGSSSQTSPKQRSFKTALGLVSVARHGSMQISAESTLVGELSILLGYLPVKRIPLDSGASKLEEGKILTEVPILICGGLVGSSCVGS